MNLWIRSRDKERLTIIQDFYIEKEQDYVNHRIDFVIYGINLVNDDIRIGTYISKERALEVLDEIQNRICGNQGFILTTNSGIRPDNIKGYTYCGVYEMPKE